MHSKRVMLPVSVILFLIVAIASAIQAKDEKLKPDQLIAKHLESIGPMEKLKTIKTRTTGGPTHVDIHVGGQANVTGEGNIVSDGRELRVSLKYPSLQYPGEQFVFDGNKTSVGMITPGLRSPLGTFLFENDDLLKTGLMFGTLSTSWFFLNTDVKQLKFDLNGPKKIEGRSLYELKYVPRKGINDINVFFYFDPETFRHVRTQLRREVVPADAGGKISDSAETTRYTLTELFDDFKAEDGLTLPHSYKLEYSIDSPRGGFVGAWEYKINQVVHNQSIEAQVFSTK